MNISICFEAEFPAEHTVPARSGGHEARRLEKWLNDKYGDKSRARKWDYQPA
jgi:hypothetical protein